MKNEETKEKNEYSFHDSIISWAFIIWAIASLGLMIFFTGLDQVTFSIMTFGQLFIVMGLITITRKQYTIAGVFSITGLSCIILPAINEWGHLFNINVPVDGRIIPILLSTAFTLIGLALMFVPNWLENRAEKRCGETVTAEIVDLKAVEASDGSTVYAPVYSYTYNNEVYAKELKRYSKNNVPVVGTKEEIKVNKNNPEEIYVPASKASIMLILIFGFAFFIAGVGMLITVLGTIR